MAQCWTQGCNRQAEPNTPFCKECLERFIREHPESGASGEGRVGLQSSQHHGHLARPRPQMHKPETGMGSTASVSAAPSGSLLGSTPRTCDEYENFFRIKCKTRGCFNRAESPGGYCKECGEAIRKAQEEKKRQMLENQYVDEIIRAEQRKGTFRESERRWNRQQQMKPLVDLGIKALKNILKW